MNTHIYIYVYIHTYTHTYIYIYMYLCISMYMYICETPSRSSSHGSEVRLGVNFIDSAELWPGLKEALLRWPMLPVQAFRKRWTLGSLASGPRELPRELG